MPSFGLPEERPPGLDSPWAARAIKYMAKAQVKVFEATNGRIGNTWRVGAGFKKPVPTLLLHHVGRTSGREFTTPLLYLADRPGAPVGTSDLVIVGSQGGMPKHPQWYRNLLAQPDVAVSLPGRRRVAVHARQAPAEEKAQLWPRLVDLYADFEKYERWTDREIPVLVLSPR
ncbi:nitroreductase/quinone reductase family protein [Nocardioides acrostichi]|uniref:Nitroreductase family deazaflavin-dependent oxidoreductase n=1 Tax=Nocardioides acrostichi TaxID=2784339 RepID=A0A930UZV9_9ACTN|nr:nitroreductase/quinone reductase family protein [Nocardioides acrostichi]MBF4161296.1 nitroreductase family deazaflavin-dependent oxidoreductase [Nocardioides acrostichi]